MGTKLKNFSYSIITKTIAFVILITTICIAIFGICSMLISDKFVDFEATIASSIYEDNNYRYKVANIARSVYDIGAYYKSEENIKAGNLLTEERLLNERDNFYSQHWADFYNSSSYSADNYRDTGKFNLSISMFQKTFDEMGNVVITLDESMMTEGQVKFEKYFQKELLRITNDLISNDIWAYRAAMDEITHTAGVQYYAVHSGNVFANIEKSSIETLKRNEVYFYEDARQKISHIGKSNSSNALQYGYSSAYDYAELNEGDSIFVTFTDEFSKQAIETLTENRATTMSLIKIAGVLTFFALFCLIYLICTTGKKEKNGQVHINWLDRIYTEVLAIACILGLTFYFVSAEWCVQYSNINFVMYLTIAASAIGLLMLLSIVRRFKAHQFIQTTLCLRLLCAFSRWVKLRCNNVYNAYNGGSVCHKAVWAIVTFGILCCATIFFFPIAIILIVAAAVVVGRCAKDYEAVVEGTKKIRAGNLDYNINTDSKTIFTPLISDLNSIAEGLNHAVESELKSERMKSELITNVSHDIRTPLTSIITYVDLINKEGLQSPEAPHYLEIIEQKSQRLKTLTDDLFEVSKASSGNINVELEDVDLASLIKQGMGELDDKIVQSGLDFKINMSDTAVNVRADGKLVWRVIENLLSNVFKYALAQSRVYIDVSQDAVSAHFIMKNISATELNVSADELTERFKRGDSSRQSEGSGLGLAIAKNLIELQNGTFNLTVDGDLFKAEVTLPRAN